MLRSKGGVEVLKVVYFTKWSNRRPHWRDRKLAARHMRIISHLLLLTRVCISSAQSSGDTAAMWYGNVTDGSFTVRFWGKVETPPPVTPPLKLTAIPRPPPSN